MRLHLDLFSGIGGFALAAESVWPGIEHVFCDNDPFSQAVLKKHWPKSKIYGDIRTLTNAQSEQANSAESSGLHSELGVQDSGVFLLTGGFPCQPFSQAGRRKGTEDDRYLWPEMFRVISEFHPMWVIAENVGGLVTWNDGMVLEQVCANLEGQGYQVQPIIIPAVSVNAPHRRDRVWIIAHDEGLGIGGSAGKECGIQERELEQNKQNGREVRCESEGCIGEFNASHPKVEGLPESGEAGCEIATRNARRRGSSDDGCNADYSKHERLEGYSGADQEQEKWKNQIRPDASPSWSCDWPSVAARLCTLDDGLPDGLVRPKGWRNAALKAAGNAIVPQVAREIMQAIKNIQK